MGFLDDSESEEDDVADGVDEGIDFATEAPFDYRECRALVALVAEIEMSEMAGEDPFKVGCPDRAGVVFGTTPQIQPPSPTLPVTATPHINHDCVS